MKYLNALAVVIFDIFGAMIIFALIVLVIVVIGSTLAN